MRGCSNKYYCSSSNEMVMSAINNQPVSFDVKNERLQIQLPFPSFDIISTSKIVSDIEEVVTGERIFYTKSGSYYTFKKCKDDIPVGKFVCESTNEVTNKDLKGKVVTFQIYNEKLLIQPTDMEDRLIRTSPIVSMSRLADGSFYRYITKSGSVYTFSKV